MSKINFGFKNINGNAFDIKIVESPDGSWPTEKTILSLTNFVVREMNKAGRDAQRIAKSPGWSPKLSGALIKSIKWLNAESGQFTGRVLTGALSVGVPYGRRQEFENKKRSRYLARAMEAAFPSFVRNLQEKGAIEDVIFGRRKQFDGGQRF